MKPYPLAGKTLKAKIYIAYEVSWLDLDEPVSPAVFTFDPSKNDPDWMLLGTQDVEMTVPLDFDPTAQSVAALEAKKAQIVAEFTAQVAEIKKRLSELQAIEYTEPQP